MKPLYTYILEARGIVTGDFDWSELVETIMSYMPGIEVGKYEIDEKELPSWLTFLTVEVTPYGEASYEYRQSRLIGDKMDAYIKIPEGKSQFWYKLSINHELQHAFDDWIARTRRGRDCGFDDRYCISTGYEYENLDWDRLYDLVTHPRECSYDHIFNILSQATYSLNQSEVNAYLREFNIYMNELEKLYKIEWSFNDVLEHPNNGLNPLICLNCLWSLKKNINMLDIKDEDWPWVGDAINEKWTKMFLGHSITGTGKEVVKKIVDELFKRYGRKVVKRYQRVLDDHNIEIKEEPEWFKI